MIVMKTSLGFSGDGDKCVVKIRGHVNPDGSSGVFVIEDVDSRSDQRVFGKDLSMSKIKLPIEVGQKFLSNGEVVEVISITRKHKTYPIVTIGETSGGVDVFSTHGKYFADRDNVRDLQPLPEPEIVIPEGVDFQITSEAMKKKCRELQGNGRKFASNGKQMAGSNFDGTGHPYRMLPITITEGVEFWGEAYRATFDRLVKEGREFGTRGADNVLIPMGFTEHVPHCKYVLLPQHRDINGNALKVGDRVRVDGVDGTITEFNGDLASTERMTFGLRACRKLTTRTRPLCDGDLEKAMHPMFRKGNRIEPACWSEKHVYLRCGTYMFGNLADVQWRPSPDQPWQPCEVTEEVLV